MQLIILHKHTGVLTAHRGKQSNQAQRTQTLSIFIHSFAGWKKKKKELLQSFLEIGTPFSYTAFQKKTTEAARNV